MKSIAMILTTSLWLLVPGLSLYGQDNPLVQEEGSVPALPASDKEAPQPEAEAEPLSTQNLIVTRSDDRTEVRGFSAEKGRWENLTLPKSDRFEWYASSDVAIVRAGDTLAAFSAETGHWDVLVLSKDSTAVCTNHGTIATINDGGHFYTFSAKTSSWTSPTDTRLTSAEQRLPPVQLSSETLAAFQTWSDSLPWHKQISLTSAVDGVRLRASRKEYVEEALYKLNELMANEKNFAPVREPDPDTTPDTAKVASPFQKDPAPSEKLLRQITSQIDDLKSSTLQRDKALRDAVQGRVISDPEVLARVREEAAVAFDARQRWYQLEAERLELRLLKIKAELAHRTEARDHIIDQRVRQLQTQRATRLFPGDETSSEMPDKSSSPYNPNTIGTAQETPAPQASDTDVPGKQAAPATAQASRDAELWPSSPKSPADTVRALRGAKAQVERLKQECLAAEEQIQRWSRPLEVLQKEQVEKPLLTQEDVDTNLKRSRAQLQKSTAELQNAEADWKLLWAEYESQIRILNSELDSAKIKTEQAIKLLDISRPLAQQGVIPQSELHSHEAIVAAGEQEVIRASERLKLLLIVKEQQSELMPPAAAAPASEAGFPPARE
ncbi:MAG: hypothetical protein JNM43_09265 [Planctomycetaceae bacterium]|nr:hypothetical protein [Planctomycetaceae bacterium]